MDEAERALVEALRADDWIGLLIRHEQAGASGALEDLIDLATGDPDALVAGDPDARLDAYRGRKDRAGRLRSGVSGGPNPRKNGGLSGVEGVLRRAS